MSFCTLQATKATTFMKLILFHSLLSRPGSEVINTSYETVCRACSRVCITLMPRKNPKNLGSEKTTLFQEQSVYGTEHTALSHYTWHLRWEFKSRSSLAQVNHMCLVWKPIKHIAEVWILKQVVLLFTVSSGDSISPISWEIVRFLQWPSQKMVAPPHSPLQLLWFALLYTHFRNTENKWDINKNNPLSVETLQPPFSLNTVTAHNSSSSPFSFSNTHRKDLIFKEPF